MAEKEGEAWSRRAEEAFSRITGEDQAIIDNLDNQLKFAEGIDRMEKERLGRSLMLARKLKRGEKVEKENTTTIGYILPLNEENTRHLVLFKNRKMVIIEPFAEETEEAAKESAVNYKVDFSRQTIGAILTSGATDLDDQVEQVIGWMTQTAEIVESNSSQDQVPILDAKQEIKRGVTTGRRLKEKEEKRLNDDVRAANEIFELEFGRDWVVPPEDQPPSSEVPPSA